MDSISKYMLIEIAYKLPFDTLHKLSLIGFNQLFNDRFWRRYCIKRNIVLSTYPWPQRVYLWEKRRPVWTIIDETPWDPDSQNPKVVWGRDDNQVIEYGESEIAQAVVMNDIQSTIELDVHENSHTSSWVSDTGFFETKYVDMKTYKIIYFVRYCPYDQCHVGYCIVNDNTINFTINRSISYSGHVTDGLRQGRGILTFDSGFIIDSEDFHIDELDINSDESSDEIIDGVYWNDKNIINSNIGDEPEGLPGEMQNILSQMLERYIYWCKDRKSVV